VALMLLQIIKHYQTILFLLFIFYLQDIEFPHVHCCN
jgi:hypothetical protein